MKNKLRIVAKKRINFNLGLKAKEILKNKIHICLNEIFLTNKNIQTASLYFPINNEISLLILLIIYKKKCNTLFTLNRQKKFFDFQEMDTYRPINTRSTWYNATFKNADIHLTTNISSSNAFI